MAQTQTVNQVTIENPRIRLFKAMLGRLWQNKLAVFGGVVTFLLIFTAIFAQWLAPYDPTAQNYNAVLQGPSAEYLFGTDNLGRDILSRVIYGAQVSLQAGLISVGIALAVGVPIGLISGYYRGFIDEYIIMRLTDAMLSIPALVLALSLAAVLGAGLTNAMIAIGLVLTPNFVRLIRGEVLAHREREYVEAGKASGISDFSIILKHILPNTIAPIMVQATLAIAAAIIVEASLSYLGLGVQPPDPSWGSMLANGQGYLDSAPWMALFPGSLIFITVIAINLFGDGIRDMLDPKMK